MPIGTSMVVHKACIEKAKDVGGELDKFLLNNLMIDVTWFSSEVMVVVAAVMIVIMIIH